MNTLPHYTVTADGETGEWLEEPRYQGEVNRDEWLSLRDDFTRHFDTYEVDGETRAIEIIWR